MIYSDHLGLVFLKGKKVASTSVEIALSALCGPEDIITPIMKIDEQLRLQLGYRTAQNYAFDPAEERPYIEQLRVTPVEGLQGITMPRARYYNHMPLTEVVALHGELPANHLLVCVERNPYRKIISFANWVLSAKKYTAGGDTGNDLTAVKASVDRMIESGEVTFLRNIDIYRKPDGGLDLHVMRYEHLHEDFARLVARLGIERVPELPHVKKGILSESVDIDALLDREQLHKINELFAEEFETFGYAML